MQSPERKIEYEREWNRKNMARRVAINHKWRAERVRYFKEIKACMICAHCGEKDPVCLEFHHKDPAEKDLAIATGMSRWSRKRLEEEIAKCIVLCSNCHKKEHARLEATSSPVLGGQCSSAR